MKECYEQSTSFDGDTIFEKVPTCDTAKTVIEDMGYKVEDMRVQPILIKKRYIGEDAIFKRYIHVHFFNPQGTEIGYWTANLNVLRIFKTPRVWDRNMFHSTELPCNHVPF